MSMIMKIIVQMMAAFLDDLNVDVDHNDDHSMLNKNIFDDNDYIHYYYYYYALVLNDDSVAVDNVDVDDYYRCSTMILVA